MEKPEITGVAVAREPWWRWVLIGVAILAAGFAGGGTWLRSGGLLIWRRRRLL